MQTAIWVKFLSLDLQNRFGTWSNELKSLENCSTLMSMTRITELKSLMS